LLRVKLRLLYVRFASNCGIGLCKIFEDFKLIYGRFLGLTYAGFWDWFMQDFWGFEIDLCKIFGQITKIVFSTHALLYLIEFFKYAITYGLMFW
jgi:hypothetical protein